MNSAVFCLLEKFYSSCKLKWSPHMQISGVFLCCTCLWILFWNPRSISVCVSRSVCDNLNQGSYLFCKSKKKTTTQLLALSCLSCQYWLMHHLLGLLILMHGSTLVSCSEAGDIVSCNQICSTFKTQSTRELYSRLHQNQQMYKYKYLHSTSILIRKTIAFMSL